MKTTKKETLNKPARPERGTQSGKPARYALLLLLACGSSAAASVPAGSGTVAPPLYAAAPIISDTDITTAVKTEFGVRPTLSAESIQIATNEGIVQLSGTADNILAKDRAEEIAMATKGVRGVVNRIQVKASGRSDAEILKDVEKAMLMNPATDSYELKASVADGKVTLTGTVDSWAESQIANTVAKKVKGVRQVDNNIALEYKTDRIDGEIATDIGQKLRYDVRVNDAWVVVKVKDGPVT